MKGIWILAGLALAAISAGAGCQSAPAAKHYPIQAEVISVDAPNNSLTIKHGDIPGFMPGMTMSYMVAQPKEMEKLGPGDKITADLVVSNNIGRLEKIVLVEEAAPVAPATAPPGKTQ
jgi:Cu/Ag efflux protein CusF